MSCMKASRGCRGCDGAGDRPVRGFFATWPNSSARLRAEVSQEFDNVAKEPVSVDPRHRRSLEIGGRRGLRLRLRLDCLCSRVDRAELGGPIRRNFAGFFTCGQPIVGKIHIDIFPRSVVFHRGDSERNIGFIFEFEVGIDN